MSTVYEGWSHEKYAKMDIAFQRAMAKALKAGLEHSPVGISTKWDTERPIQIIPFRLRSFGTSPATACADLGEPRVMVPKQRQVHRKTHA